ncbi:Integrator complex subunit 8 [Orchesella cincta]|uniref:Integrator complex subunit 8 n=1 Tax=Orchesella cincta TaxID=48709 RepID=A0A1D2NEH8_ORCCI|nr:Integrator complex subunit 8 [Orchesella cincta]
MKDCLKNLSHLTRGGGCATGLYPKLFSGWVLPIPVHHAILNIPAGPFLDMIYVLVAKSRQFLTINMFHEAREMLVAASLELGAKLKQSIRSGGGMGTFFYNISKLTKMLEWEILLIDISKFFIEFDSSSKSISPDLIGRCKDCLQYLHDQNNDVNPRSEIVENILMALINIGEYNLVIHYDQSQSQRYPFLDFLTLLARVCHDLFVDRKDTSSNYRELWSAVLPLFSSYNTLTGSVMVGPVISGNPKKLGSSSISSSKPAILSSRHLLMWAIDRSCSQNLISVWVSLLARLHNHILDDVGLQILTENLHIWPNILDDVTAGSASGIADNKVSRVAGSSKLNSRHIRDFLFHLLEKAFVCTSGCDMIAWLRCMGDVHLAAGVPASAMKCYVEYLSIGTEFFEKHNSTFWGDNSLFKRMIKCCEMMGCHTQAVILCQFLTEVDYSMAFGKAQEKITSDASDALYGFIWDLTILEFLINLHSKRNETTKRQEAIKVMGLLELNSNNNEEIQRESMCLRKSQFMRTLAKQYVFL